MFNEDEDWSDDGESQTTSKTTAKGPQKKNSPTKLKAKPVSKKSLLRTLQTLGSVPEWKNDDHQEDSDSEVEAAPSPTKKKKRRKKKRRHAETSGDQEESGGGAEESVQEENPAPKKRKKDSKPGPPKAKSASAGKTEVEKITDSDQPNANKPENTDRLSRQQWKNKMKNRRKCKNRYRQDQPVDGANNAADKQELKEEVKEDPLRKDSSEKTTRVTLKEKKLKPQKAKKTTEVSKKQPVANKGNEKSSNVEKNSSESAVNGSTQKPDESKKEVTNDHQQITNRQKAEQSKLQNLKREKLRKLLQGLPTVQHESPAEPSNEPVELEEPEEPVEPEEAKPSEASSFRTRMEQRLDSARFRYINEVLYSTSSGEAKRMFKQDPQAFWVYHKGYTAQVQRWPANPVDDIISYIQKRSPSLVVADFGCGDCKIARSVKNKVHSFDLAATCELVTVCDMAHVPLKDGSVDIAVFCLSLMGTNLVDFLSEANRVLKTRGVLKIAEVASRFDNVRNFITALARLGFKMASKDTENTHFYSFEFEKTGNSPESGKKLGLQLKPCLYKKR